MHRYRRARRALVLTALACVLVPASALAVGSAGSGGVAVQRPGVAIVKRALVKRFAVDQENSVDKVTLRFRALKLLPTRKAVPYRDFVEPDRWVTPVAAVFDQRTVRTGREPITDEPIVSCSTYRFTFTGIFWRGDFGWEFKNRNVTYKRISSSC